MNIEKFFPFVTDILFRARYITYVSAVNMELRFVSDADSVRFPVVAAPPTPISLLEQSVFTCFHPLYLFSTIYSNLFYQVTVGVFFFLEIS